MQCTRSCGDGIQTRQVICDGAEFCDTSKKPVSQRRCNVIPCSVLTTTMTSPSTTFTENEINESVTDTSLKSTENIKLNQTEHVDMVTDELESESLDKETSTHDLMSNTSESEIQEINVHTEIRTQESIVESHFESLESFTDEVEPNKEITDEDKTQEPHKHRHHHVVSKVENEQNQHSDNLPKEVYKTLKNSDNNLEDDIHNKSKIDDTDIVATEDNVNLNDNLKVEDESSQEDDVHPSKDTLVPINEVSKSTNKKYGLPPLTNLDNLPLLPKNKELPSLPNIKDLPPLPNLDELPPINSAEFDNLPKLSNLPSLDSLPPLPGKGPLPNTKEDKTLSQTKTNIQLHETHDLDKNDIIPSAISPSVPQHIEETKEDNTEFEDTNKAATANSENIAKLKIPNIQNIHLGMNDTRNEEQNLTFSDSISLSEITENGPVLPKVESSSQDYKWNPLDWTEVCYLPDKSTQLIKFNI